ncbi:MAG: DUF4956 domain-containing protein [Lachnospiraceae bacterium]|nr:DUF4956 domain-containing protein [Candidatus Colinaster equi]
MNLGLLTNVYGTVANITLLGVIVSILVALFLGGALANVYWGSSGTNSSKGYAITLALLPAIITMIVLLVSSNFGAGIAVAGAFALIKFKSAAGTAKEIVSIFIDISFGIACGTGYVLLGLMYGAVILGIYYCYMKAPFWENHKSDRVRLLEIEVKSEEDKKLLVSKIMGVCESVKLIMERGVTKKGKTHIQNTYKVKLKGVDENDLIKCIQNLGIKVKYKVSRVDKNKNSML